MEKKKISTELKQMFNKKGKVILLSTIGLTIAYWFLALWYTNKIGYTKDLILFNALAGPIFNYNPWLDYWQYIYQFAMAMLLFFVIPFLIVKLYLKEDFKDYGLKKGNFKLGMTLVPIFTVLLFIVSLFASQDPILQSEYPLSKLMGSNWAVYIYYEAMYFFYFYAYEVMMRGYLQWGLKREDTTIKGIIVIIIIQTIITTLFHVGKPMSEIMLALAMGPILGYVAIKLDSIWYGLVLHFIINIFNDFFILSWLEMLPV